MGKKVGLICKNCGYKVFASVYGGGFSFGASSYSCFICKNVTEITEWSEGDDKNGPRTYYEIKCGECGNANPKTLHKWEHDSIHLENNYQPCPVCKTQLTHDPTSSRLILYD